MKKTYPFYFNSCNYLELTKFVDLNSLGQHHLFFFIVDRVKNIYIFNNFKYLSSTASQNK